MGMDFVALMKYGGPDERLARVLDRLEDGSPPEVQALARLMRERRFCFERHERAVWEFRSRPELRDRRLARRPVLPDLAVSLWLPEGFSLTFGPDAVEVYHLLRWLFFLTEPALQRAVLDSCVCLGHLFGATDCIVTSDYSPVIQAFREGQRFEVALASAGQEHGERPRLADLYLEIPLAEVVRLIERPGRPSHSRQMDWDLDRPPPEGWQRATTWDSRGYWRLELRPAMTDPLADWAEAGPDAAASGQTSRGATKPTDEVWWAECGEPAGMLDHLLKQDGVSWRKVRLWACACVRRIWARLTSEPGRRAVEVVERFAEGQAEQRAVDNAANAAGRVKKGDRRANYAAARLARLCSSVRFPPAHVSDLVVDVVERDADQSPARAAERRAHADLLRDVFGNPFRPVRLDPSWLTPTVVGLAETAYNDRILPSGHLDPARLAVLADALEEAGAADSGLPAHLRTPGPHVRGCHVLDLLTGRS
jgi:hypothetical protein